MSDESWKRAHDSWDRLRWARARLYPSARAAADALGMQEGTYRQYERGPGSSRWANLTHERAVEFARRFKVSWLWLLTGNGQPLDAETDRGSERILQLYGRLTQENRERLIALLESFVPESSDNAINSEPRTQSRRLTEDDEHDDFGQLTNTITNPRR